MGVLGSPDREEPHLLHLETGRGSGKPQETSCRPSRGAEQHHVCKAGEPWAYLASVCKAG